MGEAGPYRFKFDTGMQGLVEKAGFVLLLEFCNLCGEGMVLKRHRLPLTKESHRDEKCSIRNVIKNAVIM